jgi:hypothetical protein
MYYNVDPQDLLRQIGFNSRVAQARECLADLPGILARVIEHTRGDLKKGAITYVKARRPLIPLTEPAAGA